MIIATVYHEYYVKVVISLSTRREFALRIMWEIVHEIILNFLKTFINQQNFSYHSRFQGFHNFSSTKHIILVPAYLDTRRLTCGTKGNTYNTSSLYTGCISTFFSDFAILKFLRAR